MDDPGLLLDLTRTALDPFYDRSLRDRVAAARRAWLDEADEVIFSTLGGELDRLRAYAQATLEGARASFDELNDSLSDAVSQVELPQVELPDAELAADTDGTPLIDLSWSFYDQCQALVRSRAYR